MGVIRIIVSLVGMGIIRGWTTAQLQPLVEQSHFSILPNQISQVANTNNMDNPIRQGSLEAAQSGNLLRANTRDGVIGGDDSILTTITIIRNGINYLLGFLGLIALIFMLWHGFRYVSQEAEEAAQDAVAKIKQAAIAIGGIGISWFVVSFILYIINLLIR
ncbi:MAG: hypothetical protein NZL83_03875 [Candidatus Absconditabacterales bacterium]|nr:hypothetical protein [Candidatus Absconditabacterales bacterium]